MKSILRSVWPELLMVAIMAVLAVAFMSPVIEGKTLFQNDIVQAKHMSSEVDKFQKETGEYSAWTNSAFGGMPAYQIKSAPSRNVFQWLFHAFKLFLPGYTVAILFLCMVGFYFLLRTLKLDKWLALAGAIAFGFGAHHLQLIGTGHVSKIYAIAYMAPVIAGVLLVFRRKYLAGGLVAAIGFGIQLVTNHVQVSYYTGMILLVYCCVELVYAIKDKYFDHLLKAGITLIAAVILAVLPNMTNLLTTMEYSKETTRGKSELVREGVQQTKGLDLAYITDWSYGIGETMNLYIPDLYGGGGSELSTHSESYKVLRANGLTEDDTWRYVQSQTYWGNQPFTAGPHYIGAITIFLAILGLLVIRGKEKWWLSIVIVLSVFLAWGKNFMGFTEFFVNYVPLFSKFRDATNSLIIAQIAIPILAFLAVRDWFAWEAEPKVKLRKLYISTGIAGGIAVLIALIPTLAGSFTAASDAGLPDWLREPLRNDRIALARQDAIRTLIFVLLAAGVLWYSLRGKVKKEYLYIGLAVLILADMWIVDKRYLNKDNFSSKSQYAQALKPWPADEAIKKSTELSYRVFDVTASTFKNGHASGFHHSLGGYHGAKLRRYDELSETYMIQYIIKLKELMNVEKPSLESFQQAIADMPLIHMMNTRYIILRPNLPLRNPHAYGNAWFVDGIRWAANANEEMEAVGSIQLTHEAVIDRRFKDQVGSLPGSLTPGSQPDTIKLVEYKPNYLKYEAEASQSRLAVFSEIYYPYGWQAYVDGKEAGHLRADYVLRAMVLPAGKHTVEFRFDPQSLKTGQTISLIGTILVLILVAGLAVIEGRRQRAKGKN